HPAEHLQKHQLVFDNDAIEVHQKGLPLILRYRENKLYTLDRVSTQINEPVLAFVSCGFWPLK
ncbi:MAG: hypothetical protein WCI38_11695, partial [Chthoniobacterales bacterium]